MRFYDDLNYFGRAKRLENGERLNRGGGVGYVHQDYVGVDCTCQSAWAPAIFYFLLGNDGNHENLLLALS